MRQVKHHMALPYDELPDFMVTPGAQAGMAARFEFLILTAARTGEATGPLHGGRDTVIGSARRAEPRGSPSADALAQSVRL